MLGQSGRDVGDRQHKIRHPSPDRAGGHAVIARLRRILNGNDAAFRLDGRQARSAVRPGAGQHHTGRPHAILLRQRVQ